MVRLECFVVLAFIQEGKGEKKPGIQRSLLTLPLNEEESRRL